MKKPLLTLALVAMLVFHPHVVARQTPASITQNQGLTVGLVIGLLNAGVPPSKVVELIQQTQSDFNLSLADINNLPNASVPESVLDAMLRARKIVSVGDANPPAPRLTSAPNTTGGTPGTVGTGGTGGTDTPGSSGGTTPAAQVPEHSAVRLSAAKAVQFLPSGLPKPEEGRDGAN